MPSLMGVRVHAQTYRGGAEKHSRRKMTTEVGNWMQITRHVQRVMA